MKLLEIFKSTDNIQLDKKTLLILRWIAIVGQIVTINLVYFIFDFKFDFILANLIIFIGILSNLYLIYINQKTQLLDKIAFIFLLISLERLLSYPNLIFDNQTKWNPSISPAFL